ncbi:MULTISPECIES: ABC transporter ATP-binding protein [unclassified Rhizobium]|uniref:ABC transporter ATP-binding protein n=1 Tax=unclassified Rhizobium TaxID=2613769 RepID=UPI0017848DB7|nr:MULTISPECIES: ABC transporter ATP-binding protein [unclassified Rhizobium]MBD8688175.1 ABC transporter ATP-binding protein [Rhizobium sp. CFBP 13644]MBD8692630.1 ABC transporter ATP-binding protein [Rhizobium sp. CFBP 13717]
MLEVRNLSKSFGGLKAVTDASLDVPEGSIVGLLGPNGAGKTTCFTMIAGFTKPDEGAVRFQGKDIVGLAPHSICALGMIRTFQIVQPFAGLTVQENIAVGAYLHHHDRREAMGVARDVGKRLGMGAMLDRPASSLTIAGRKRLELARALATGAKLLLLDEVMAGLIPSEITEIVGIIRKIREEGHTFLMIEHVMQAVMQLAETAYVLNQGKMIAHGTPRELVKDPSVVEAYLGHGAAARLQEENHA